MFSHLSHRVFFIGCDEVKNFTPLSALTPRKKILLHFISFAPFSCGRELYFLAPPQKGRVEENPMV